MYLSRIREPLQRIAECVSSRRADPADAKLATFTAAHAAVNSPVAVKYAHEAAIIRAMAEDYSQLSPEEIVAAQEAAYLEWRPSLGAARAAILVLLAGAVAEYLSRGQLPPCGCYPRGFWRQELALWSRGYEPGDEDADYSIVELAEELMPQVVTALGLDKRAKIA